MKRSTIVLAISAVVFFAANPRADLIRTTQFVDYNTGNLGADAKTGQQDQWFVVGNAGTITVTNGVGSLDGTKLGLAPSAGDRVFISADNQINTSRNQFAAAGTFPTGSSAVDTNLYYSFLFKFLDAADVDAAGEIMIRVNRANSGTGTAQHWDLLARNAGGQIQLGLAKAGAPSNVTNWAAVTINAGQTLFIVVRQHIIPGVQNDVYDLWVNPPAATLGKDESSVPAPDATVGADEADGAEDQSNTGPGRLVLASGLNAEFDEFRVATTWAEATPPLGQCASAAIAGQPANVVQSAEISATFKVAASGSSPTIQWQMSTDAGATWKNIDGATAASYTTAPLSIVDASNWYRALVAVPCDNSFATSKVVTATLTAPVATPAGLVLDDTFTDPDLGFDDRANPPVTSSNSVWYTSVTDNLTAFSQGGNMVGIPVSGGSSLWLGYFTETNAPPVHLAVGRALKVTLPFTPGSYASFTNNGRLRLGLFDYADGGTRITEDSPAAGGSRGNGRGVRGYMLNLDFGPSFSNDQPLQILARTFLDDDNLMGSIGSYASLGSGPDGAALTGEPAFEAGTEYTLEFTVARTAVNSVAVTTKISGGGMEWSHTITDTNYVYHRFDTFALRPNSLETSADMFTFPEFKVEVTDVAVAPGPFSITNVERGADGAITLTWESQAGTTYQVLSSPDIAPATWSIAGTVAATGNSSSYTDPTPVGTHRFYRIVTAP